MRTKHFARKLVASVAALLMAGSPAIAENQDSLNAVNEARNVIERFTGGKVNVNLELSLSRDSEGRDIYSTECAGGTLTVRGSSGVALCRGFYDYIKSQGAGICSWSGNRFDANVEWADQARKSVRSPFRDHYYMNVVTHGYSTPYWDEDRWDKEIDWMALHGMDMPLVLMAQEAVYRIVFKNLGMKDSEIDEWQTGPAHLPWMRMGNLAGNSFDGPLTRAWDEGQIALTKHVLQRMHRLGMKPITPAFGGFVPPAFSNYYSGTIDRTGWDWVPTSYRNSRLNPSSTEFVKVGRMFVETWDSIFGAGKYYLSDSFNEMTVPNDKTLLKQYGDSIYKSITSANPEATWVMQGWTLGYQRGSWNNGRFEALVKGVPDDRFMMLDMATDYNKYIWGNGWNWDVYPKFYGKEWVWSVIPNMGGKTAMTGRLEHYANGRLEALNSSNKGNLTGYGFAPEGIENNEIVYELLCDGGWTSAQIDLDNWMKQYAQARYGNMPKGMAAYYTGLRNSVYNSFTDHPRYGWQTGNYNSGGSVNQNKAYNEGVEALFDAIKENKEVTPLLNSDLVEAAAFYASGKVASFCSKINAALDLKEKETALEYLNQLDTLMRRFDAALTCHPLYRLELWEEQAQKMGTTATEKEEYARNARRIVSVWYGNHTYTEPVMDYAARVWSGMVRDYYWPRMKTYFENKIYNRQNSLVDVENAFVNAAPNLSAPEVVPEDTLGYLCDLVGYARTKAEIVYEKLDEILASNDYENHWYAIRSGADNATANVITQNGDNGVLKAQSYTVSGTQMWRFIKSGTEEGVYRIENRFGQNISGTGTQSNHPTASTTTANTLMKLVLAPDGSKRWFIYPGNQEKQALHVNIAASSQLTTWSSISDDGTEIYSGSTWTIEHVDDALVPETTNDDYARYINKLEALRNTPMNGKAGQVKSAEALEAAIDSLEKWADNIDHSSYNSFLAKWARLYDGLFEVGDATAASETSVLCQRGNQVSAITSGNYYVIAGYAQNGVTTNFLYEENGGVKATALSTGSAAANVFVWQLTGNDTDGYVMQNLATGHKMSLGTSNGSAITMGDASQNLAIMFDSNNYAMIYNTASNQAIDVAYAGTSPTTWACGSTPDGSRRLFIYEADMALFDDGEYTWYTIQNKLGGYVSLNSSYMDGNNLLLSNTTRPSDRKSLWRAERQSDGTYRFMNYTTGYNHVLAFTGSEADARAMMVDASTTSSEATYTTYFSFYDESALTSGDAAYIRLGSSGNNYWNKRGNYLALWSSSGAIGDNGSTFYFTEVDPDDFDDYAYSEFNTVNGVSSFDAPHPLTLWYNQPSSKTGVSNEWMEYALPIGNGQLGATEQGKVYTDEIQFNEKTLWSGNSSIKGNPYHGYYRNFGSIKVRDVSNTFSLDDNSAPVKNYVRYLDIEDAIAGVQFQSPDLTTTYRREYLSSNPDQVVAAHYTAEGGNKLSLRFSFEPGSSINASTPVYSNGTGSFSGKLDVVSYHAMFKVVSDGTVTTKGTNIVVKDATEVLLLLAAGTDYNGLPSTGFVAGTSELANTMASRISAAEAKGWTALRADHIADFQSYMGRVNLQLDKAAPSNTRTTQALVNYYSTQSATSTDPEALFLEQLYFNYGRYLEISSSRGIDAPNNLQGIWNNLANAPWNSDIHTNINIQMNYWPAEPTNLSETHLPFLNYIINMKDSPGFIAARDRAGQTKGWTVFTESNIFGGMSTFMTNYTIANAWYCTHLWQHYRYTLDKDYLKRAFPSMWGAAQFWMERLVLNSNDGTYECPNEWSPEHGPSENATAHSQQLVSELFSNVLEAYNILGSDAGVSESDINTLTNMYNKLDKGLGTETYSTSSGFNAGSLANGSTLLREWKSSSYTVGENGHRHLSHLMCLYPFSQVSKYDANPTLYQAAVNSLTLRGDAATGWSLGWKVNCWARAHDGDHAHTIIHNALKHSTSYGTNQYAGGVYYNLFDSHAPFQIDGNFGTCAGIAEMLMQSVTGVIDILPALPSAWPSGSVTGLKAVGNNTVGIEWANGKAKSVTILSNKGGDIRFRSNDFDAASSIVRVNGTIVTPTETDGVYTLTGINANDQVEISFGNAPTILADGIYTISNNYNQRGTIVYSEDYASYPVLADVGLSGYTNNDVDLSSVGSGQYWYVRTTEKGTYIYNVGKGNFLGANSATVAGYSASAVPMTLQKAADNNYYNVLSNGKYLSCCCGWSLANGDVRWLTHEADADYLTFTKLSDGTTTYATQVADADWLIDDAEGTAVYNNYNVNITGASGAVSFGGKRAGNGETLKTKGEITIDELTVEPVTGYYHTASISGNTIQVNYAAYDQVDMNQYTQAVVYPAQQIAVGTAALTTYGEENAKTYVLGNNALTAAFVQTGGKLLFGGSKAMNLLAGTEPFTVAFGEGSVVPASEMTLTNLSTETYSDNTSAVGGAEHFAGVGLKATYAYTYGNATLQIVWRAVLRDGSHYLRTEMELTGQGDIDMYNVIPMIYNVDTETAGSTPSVVGNTRGAVLMSNQIFAGLETPTAYNTVGNESWNEENWNLTNTLSSSLTSSSWTQVSSNNVPDRVTEATGYGYPNIYAYQYGNVTLAANQKVEITVAYTSGSHRLNFGGADLLDGSGNVCASDYHSGYSGSATNNNTFTFIAPYAGTFTLRTFVENGTESINASSNWTAKIYTAKEGVVINTGTTAIQGLWSRNTTLEDGDTWKVSSVVGLVAQDGNANSSQRRRSFLAYSERERAVPWRPFPVYISWYELNINRNNASDPANNMKASQVLDVVNHWKSQFYDRYKQNINSYVIDDGWDNYGTWTFHSNFPNEMRDIAAVADQMGSGVGAWLGPVGGYGTSGNYRRAYWSNQGQSMVLSNKNYYDVFLAAAKNLTTNQGTDAQGNGLFRFFKFDGISAQFSATGPDNGDSGNENAEGILRLERYVRENLKRDIFFNTTVGTWASPFFYHFTDATWRQENDYGTIGSNSNNREKWITYRDRLVYQNYVTNSPVCPINTLMTHGFILTRFGSTNSVYDYASTKRELRAAFACGSGMVELYNDYLLTDSIRFGKLWHDIAECSNWQKFNADVLPDIHWVGGSPWDGSKENVYGWASWNGTKCTLTLRNGASSSKNYTFTLREALNIPANVSGSIKLYKAFSDQDDLSGLTEQGTYDVDASITVSLPASSIYVFGGIETNSEVAVSKIEFDRDYYTVQTTTDAAKAAVVNNDYSTLANATTNINYTVNDDATCPVLKWTSSNPAIAEVNGGWVLGKQAGEVTITASSADGTVVKSVKVYVAKGNSSLIGDVNRDGKVSIADVTALVNMILGMNEKTMYADVNGDGKVSIADITAVVNIILKY